LEREPGAIIAGRYRLVRKLGAGGMGAVWLSHDLSLDSNCAVKIIDSEKSRNEEVKKRFVREARAAAQLRGPHVVDVFDRGECDGVLYIAMEYLEGEDLCTRLAHVGKLDAATTYRIIAHVARALSSAHALGIVHRDLKPENIFLVPGYDEEIAKVLDFGIAQHEAYRIEDHATREGAFLGTPYYVSPEQARGKPTDHRSDLWSLAVITYQCLTGQPPFDSGSLGELMGLILYEPIPRITSANPALPATIEAFWQRATYRDRELRFQSAREFANELGQALGLTTVVSVPTLAPRRPSMIPDEGDGRLVVPPSPRLSATPLQLRDLTPVVNLPNVISDATRATLVDPAAQTNFLEQSLSPTPAKTAFAQVLERGYERLRAYPRRPLIIAAVGAGILVGGLSVFAIFRATQVSVSPSVIPGEPLVSVSSESASVGSVEPAKVAPIPVAPEIIPVSSVVPVEAVNKVPDVPPKKTSSTGVRRSPPGTPDYGI
jgi:serine/threonine-protein kinase